MWIISLVCCWLFRCRCLFRCWFFGSCFFVDECFFVDWSLFVLSSMFVSYVDLCFVVGEYFGGLNLEKWGSEFGVLVRVDLEY